MKQYTIRTRTYAYTFAHTHAITYAHVAPVRSAIQTLHALEENHSLGSGERQEEANPEEANPAGPQLQQLFLLLAEALKEVKHEMDWRLDALEEQSENPTHLPDLVLSRSERLPIKDYQYHQLQFDKKTLAGKLEKMIQGYCGLDENTTYGDPNFRLNSKPNSLFYNQLFAAFFAAISIQAFQMFNSLPSV